MADPAVYYRNNLLGSLSLFDAMREAGIDWLVFSSTCATYGIPETVPVAETAPQHPVNPYGETKLAVERALRWYGEAYGLRAAVLRYFNAAGADRDGEIGARHNPESRLVPLAVDAVLGRRQLDVYGTDYPTPDGTAIRDYVHVGDLAVAHLQALEYLTAGRASIALNLGTGRGHSVREVIRAVETAAGRKVPWRAAPRRPGDPPALVADPRLAGELLDWRPHLSDLDTIVRTTLAWHARRTE
jgi:UDP-glucose-4-epimerase GalE